MSMNRAATVARGLLAASVLPVTMAAGYLHAGDLPQPASHAAAAIRTVSDVRHATGLPTGFVLGTVTRTLSAFDHAVQHKASLRVMFLRWGTTTFPAGTIARNAALGAQTVIEILPIGMSVVHIVAGDGDAWLQSVAAGIHALGDPVILSFGPEMNGQWYSWGFRHAKPTDYIAAWRHVHDLLSASNAGPLISWMWQPSAIHFSTPSPTSWWPGSKYVDEIGLDGYYVIPIDTFNVIFTHTVKLMRGLTTKPIMVGETAVGATTGHESADIKDLFAGIRRFHLRGLIWFNIPQHAGKYHQDWRLQDHPAALRTFVTQLARA
jgi:hypothetical protein